MIKIYRFWYCDMLGKWLMHVSPEWEYRKYGFRPNGKSDLLYFQSMYGLITGDVKVIKACIKLVNQGYRWPSSLNAPEADAKNRFEHILSKVKYKIYSKLFPNKLMFCKYRPQKDMTRDVLTILLVAVYWHQYELIRDIKIPRRLYTPSFHNWVKYLKTSEEKYKKRYEFWQTLEIRTKIKYPAYIKTLNAFRAWIARSQKVKQEIFLHIDQWNLLHRLLCNDFVDERDIELYIPTKGFMFNSDKLKDNPIELTEHEPFTMDKEILRFVFDNKNW